ncbi:MAG: hypothetical protein R3B82_24680 [Sandaracinaceae bacterium]
MLIQFFDDEAPPADEDAAIAALGRSKVLAAVWDAYARRRTVDASPALVTPGRGDEYGWPLRLGGVGLVVPVPEDGYVWAPAGTAQGEDDIVRLAPSMPELLVKVVRAPARSRAPSSSSPSACRARQAPPGTCRRGGRPGRSSATRPASAA